MTLQCQAKPASEQSGHAYRLLTTDYPLTLNHGEVECVRLGDAGSVQPNWTIHLLAAVPFDLDQPVPERPAGRSRVLHPVLAAAAALAERPTDLCRPHQVSAAGPHNPEG